jgi:Rod binding domain-containing protein
MPTTFLPIQTPTAGRPAASYRQNNSMFPLKSAAVGADKTNSPSSAQERACQSFEAFMIGEMLKTMRGGGPSAQGVLPVSRAESIYQRQQCEALGEILAQRQPLGIARLLNQTLEAQRR